MEAKSPRYVAVDAFRGFASLAVVFFHLHKGGHLAQLEGAFPAIAALLSQGVAGVYVFFVLSGFVIAHSMGREEVGLRYAARFMLRRSIRLDPPYWASILLAISLGFLPTLILAGKTYDMPSWQDIFLHITYLVVLLDGKEIDPVYWTLCLEIQFYLVFAVMMSLITRLKERFGLDNATDLVLYPAVVFANLWPLGFAPFQFKGLFVEHWYMFLAGVLVWRARQGHALNFYVAATNLLVLGVATFHRHDIPAFAGVFGASVLLLLSMANRLEIAFRQKPWQFLGAISYSLYLTHNPISGTAFRLAYKITGQTILWEIVWSFVVLALCIFAAWVFYRIFEVPSLRFSRKILLKRG